MFQDFKLFFGKEKAELSFERKEGRLFVQSIYSSLPEEHIAHFYYDENVYKIKGYDKYPVVKNEGSILEIALEKDTELALEVEDRITNSFNPYKLNVYKGFSLLKNMSKPH